MQKTKLFFATSSESVDNEITGIEAFFLRLNNCYIDRALYFTPVFSGRTSGATACDTDIAESGAAFFLLSADSGVDIRETYKAARDSYNKTGKPKIVIYIKTTDKPQQSEMALIREKLGTDAEFYYNAYSHIDTLKLGILMQIKQLDLPCIDIRLEDGKAWQGTDTLLNLENVESVTGYENLQNLKQKHADLERRYYAAKTRYAENPDNEAAYDEFYEATMQRSDAMQHIREIESQLFSMIEGMYVHTSQGRLSQRQAEGYRLIERGKFIEAKAVLDFNEIVRDSRREAEVIKQSAKNAQILVNELLQLKDVNATLLDWEAVDACYKEVIHIEKQFGLPDSTTIDYLVFLHRQGRYNEGIELAKMFRAHYLPPEAVIPIEEQAHMYNVLASYYYYTQRYPEAEESFLQGINLLKGKDVHKYGRGLAVIYKNYGTICLEQNRYADAEELFNGSLSIFVQLVGDDPAGDDASKQLAFSYRSLGIVYQDTFRANEAEEMYKKAIALQKELAERNLRVHGMDLVYHYYNLGRLYIEMHKLPEAEEVLTANLKICEELNEQNPSAHESLLTRGLHRLGVLYTIAGRYSEAEDILDRAYRIQKRRAESEHGTFHDMWLESTCKALGDLYRDTGRTAQAEEMLGKALEIHKQLYGLDSEACSIYLADIFQSLGALYKVTGRFAEAEETYTEALRRYEVHESSVTLFARGAADTREQLKELRLLKVKNTITDPLFTTGEREVALLLIEGDTQRDITRKLRLSSSEVSQRVKSIRDKVSLGVYDPVIAAIVKKHQLSRRETDILRCIQRSLTNAEISTELFISEESVRVHTHNLLKKLPVESKNEIGKWMTGFATSKEM